MKNCLAVLFLMLAFASCSQNKFQSLDAALGAAREPGTYLMVVYDPQDASVADRFDAFVNGAFLSQSNQYEGQTFFQFYLAGKSDAGFIQKATGSNGPAIVFVNSQKEVIGFRSDSDIEVLHQLDQVQIDLLNADRLASSDRIFNNDGATIAELKKAFLAADGIFCHNCDVAYLTEEKNEAAPEYFNYLSNESIRYVRKATPEKIAAQWNRMLSVMLQEKNLDPGMARVMINEIARTGFSNKLFKDRSDKISDKEFLALDYIFKHYDAILEIAESADNTIEADEQFLIREISKVLQYSVTHEADVPAQTKQKVVAHFKDFAARYDFRPNVNDGYLLTLKYAGYGDEFVNGFDNYFNLFVNDKASLDDRLAEFYGDGFPKNELEKSNLRDLFSYYCHEAADYVAENPADPSLLKKAVVWGETANKYSAEKEPEYQFTLARLYYKSGQIDRAAKLLKQAIKDAGSRQYDQEFIGRMKSELGKMQ